MTKLWAIYVCPFMGIDPYFDLIMSTECPKYLYNIFFDGTFFMTNRHKLHIIAK